MKSGMGFNPSTKSVRQWAKAHSALSVPIRWVMLALFAAWLGAVLTASGAGSVHGIAPDYLLGAVCFFHVLGRISERNWSSALSLALFSVASAAGGSAPAGARFLGYGLAMLIFPPGNELAKRPVALVCGLAAREAMVAAVCGAVMRFSPGLGMMTAAEAATGILLTVPAAMGMFYVLSGLGGLIGIRHGERRLSRPDTLADAHAYDRVTGRADVTEAVSF
jgi:hypothetical protein